MILYCQFCYELRKSGGSAAEWYSVYYSNTDMGSDTRHNRGDKLFSFCQISAPE